MTKRFWTLGLAALLCLVMVAVAIGVTVNGKTTGVVASGFQEITSTRFANASSLPTGFMAWSMDSSSFWFTDYSDSSTTGTALTMQGKMLLPVGEAFRDDTGKWFFRVSVNCAGDSVSYAWTNP